MQKETNSGAKRAFAEAKAAIMLFDPKASEADKLDAIAVIRDRGDQEALAILTGLSADPSSALGRVSASAISSIQSNLAIWATAQNAWYGLSLGSVLLLAAIGLAITFGVMGVTTWRMARW